ncbi:hypothetical protein KW798_01775 [Candidatus Parcubacteria bacterium]|nr:hypothetical protein [Candidatus Parcubacteria bacterium]
MAGILNIFARVCNIDDGLSHEVWRLELEGGWSILFPTHVSHKLFENGDKVLLDLEEWKENNIGHGYLFRNSALINKFSFGSSTQIENPETETVYNGKNFQIMIERDDLLTIASKKDKQVGLQVFTSDDPESSSIGAAPWFANAMKIGVSEERPIIWFTKEGKEE